MTEPVFKGCGLSLQAMLVMDSRIGGKDKITAETVEGLHPIDRNTLMVTAVYYLKEDMVQLMLENGADLAFRNFEACKMALAKVADSPQDVTAIGILRLVSDFAEQQGIDLAALRKGLMDERARQEARQKVRDTEPAEEKPTRQEARQARIAADKKNDKVCF